MRRLLSSVSCLSLAAGVAVLGAPAAPAAPGATPAPAPTVEVHRAPDAVLDGPQTGVSDGRDLVRTGGRLFLLTSDSVEVFAPGASGDAAPQRSFEVPVPSGEGAFALAVGDDGWTYVLTAAPDLSSSTVLVFAPDASGDAAYTAVDDSTYGLASAIDITDHGDGIAILDNNSNAISFFDQFRTDPGEPTGGIDAGSGTQTQVFAPITIDTAPTGELVVRGQTFVSVFAADADGDVAPSQYLPLTSRTRIGVPLGAGMDRAGNLVLATADSYEPGDRPRVLSFAPGATGDVAPQAVLAGPRTGLELPYVEVSADGTLAVGDYGPGFAGFPGGIRFFRRLGPYTAPSRPGGLDVRGRASDPRRTLTWKAASANADVPVTGYAVKVVCGQVTVLSKSLPSTQRRATATVRTIVRGRCAATVKARNRLGLGKGATISFAVRR